MSALHVTCLLLAVPGVFSLAYYWISGVLLDRWLDAPPVAGGEAGNALPAVTFFRPLKAGVPFADFMSGAHLYGAIATALY